VRSLRTRLILSHLLPLLVVVPLLGIALVYVVETQVLLVNVSDELTQQALLLASATNARPEIWTSSVEAQAFIDTYSSNLGVDVTLLEPGGDLLASSIPDETGLGVTVESQEIVTLLSGERSVRTHYSVNLQSNVTEILLPVQNSEAQMIGIIHVSQTLADAYQRFQNLRYLILGMLVIELLLGAMIGLVLALNLNRQLHQVARAMDSIASAEQLAMLPEGGPDEIRSLLHSFNTMVERLQLSQQARQKLLANLVHELGRPLGALHSAIRALINGADENPELRRDLLAGMDAQVERLKPLLDNLAELHGNVLGHIELQRRPTPLSEWLPTILGTWRAAAEEKGLHWQADIPDALPTVEIDPDRMAQVIGNVLSNAVKYTPPGGSVDIEAGTNEHEVWVSVSDSGPGISEVEQERIFQPFYRGQGSHRFPQGMGLGLTIALDLVNVHGGRLVLDSATGHGSKFTVFLPTVVTLRTMSG
jgi:two-component system, OmpR family, sensor histidine kinase BaeS